MATKQQIAAWAIRSYPEKGDAAFIVHGGRVTGGMAREFMESLRSYFVARPFVREIGSALREAKGQAATSIADQELAAQIWKEHAESFLKDMYAAHDDGRVLFGETYDTADHVEAWVKRKGYVAKKNPSHRNPADFMDALHPHLDIGDRVLQSRGGSLGGSTLFLNFYNLPQSVVSARAGGGAEAENNRMMFRVEPVAGGKVKLEHSVNALGRGYSLRGKTGTPAAVAKYLADHLNKVVREVPPNFTHTRSNPRRCNPRKATASAALIEGLQKLTEYNDHTSALVRLSVATDVAASGKATLAPSGLSELTRELEAILAARDRKGYMDAALSKRASAAYKKLSAKAKRVYTAASFAKIHAAL